MTVQFRSCAAQVSASISKLLAEYRLQFGAWPCGLSGSVFLMMPYVPREWYHPTYGGGWKNPLTGSHSRLSGPCSQTATLTPAPVTPKSCTWLEPAIASEFFRYPMPFG